MTAKFKRIHLPLLATFAAFAIVMGVAFTAAAQTATSAGSAVSTAASISRAVSTWTVLTPGGSGSATGPLTSVTAAPASARARAMAWPWRPEE